MQVIEKNLFTQISAEESANVNGGGLVEALSASSFITISGLFGLAPTNPAVQIPALLLLTGGLKLP